MAAGKAAGVAERDCLLGTWSLALSDLRIALSREEIMRMTWPEKRQLVFLLIALIVFGNARSGLAQQALLPMHLEVGPLSMLRMPHWVALSEGIYKKNGLDVDECHTPVTLDELRALGIQPPTQYTCARGGAATAAPPPTAPNAGGAPDTTPAFLSNTVRDPITMAGGFPTFLGQVLNPQQAKRKMILSTSNVTGWPIFARKDITSPEQLKGKRIGVLSFTDIHGFMAMVFAEAMGWDPRFDMTLVEEWGPPAFNSLQSGKLDAIVAVDSAQWLALQAGYKPLVDMKQWKVPMASASANADVAWLQKNRETARRFVKSQVDARALMERDRGAFNRALVKYFNVTDSRLQDHLYSMLEILPRKPYPAAEGIRKAMKLYGGFFPQLREHRVEEFIDDSFVRELDESGYIDSLYKK
jgi:ABC-type nitrate/sulfonate/bicarbonate transport system substrate-binding protein